MILLLRLVPIAVGILEAVVFWQQRQFPTTYPWILLIGILALPIGAIVITWGHVRFGDLVEKMAPTFLLITTLAFALLLIEGVWPFALLVSFATISSMLSLEVVFLMVHHPSAYPVNGISRVNIGYVPLIVWYAVATSSGLLTFLHIDRLWHLAICTALGLILFRTTGHPGATEKQNRVWVLVGACVGIEVGLLGLLLPLSMPMQGIVAAVIFCGVLRMRRYLYDPKPSARTGWSEAVALLLLSVVSLSTAKWF